MHKNPDEVLAMMTRFALVALATAAFALSAHADVTVKSQDGMVELALPNGWREQAPVGQGTKIVATDSAGGRITVHVYSKEDFNDLASVGKFIVSGLKLEGAEPKNEDTQVNGKPAIRINLTGTEANGIKRGFVITIFEVGDTYIGVTAGTTASAFAKQAQVLAGIANQLKITPGAATNPPAGPQPAAPQQPARH
jgi:hypothetical protein